ncbi:FHA domain-containing protein [Streptomyces sp. NBC_00893]|uniref:FHA domain-containing protein n=1 Tax=Streptomyces sp. NBC_00893 TaxID=2975862 RepID=UPI0022575D67|nr:FHA domain-containing protein [Streptomyces sp. NBC_00893]MCX4846840.1 FHA domain-containing protein [Streptomyces sp. NBC_00893]
MTAPVPGAGEDRDDGYDGYDDDWESVLDEEVRGPLPPPPDTAAGVRCPGCAALVPPGTRHCPRCLARIGGGGDRDGRGDGTTPPGARVVLRFDTLALSLPVRPGEPLRLGRDTDWAPDLSGAFAELTTVSRRHARVTADPDGSVWVTEENDGTVNGTWVNGDHLLPGERHRLRHGDRLQLGHRVACTVRITGDGPC